jgi:hypothetical protein
MLLLATQAVPQMRQHAHPSPGRLVTPRHHPSLRATIADGAPWPPKTTAFADGRTGATISLAALPSTILAELLGLSDTSASKWYQLDGGEWSPRYAAHACG